jgi:hypothetical protein
LVLCVVGCFALVSIEAIAQNDFNFNTSVDFLDDSTNPVLIEASCSSGNGSQEQITEAASPVALNVNGFLAGESCATNVLVSPPGYEVVSEVGDCSLVNVQADQVDVDCLYTLDVITTDLAVTVSENQDPVQAGSPPGTLTHTITVTNTGADTDNVIVSRTGDPLPGGVIGLLPGSASQGSYDGANWVVGSLADGGSATLTLEFDVTDAAADGALITSTFELANSDTPDDNAANDSGTETTTVQGLSDLAVTITESLDPVVAGSPAGTLTHTITVTNLGADTTGVILEYAAVRPADVTPDISVPPSQGVFDGLNWIIGSLANGASVTLDIPFGVPATIAAGASIESQAVIAATDVPDGDLNNNLAIEATTVAREYDLALNVVDSPDPVVSGSGTGFNLQHTFTLSRSGPSDASGVSVSLAPSLPSGVTIFDWSVSTGSFDGANWSVGEVPVGAGAATLTLRLYVDETVASCTDCISATGTVSASDGGTDTVPSNDSAVNPTSVTGATFTVGGLLSGLEAGDTVVLQNNSGDDLPLSADGAFIFPTGLEIGDAYSVTVLTQPAAPSETCTVTNGSGTMSAADVTNVSVTCTVDTFTVGGTLTGLAAGENVVLQNNGADDQVLAADGSFTFSPLADGTDYAVTVATQPTGQTCSVSNGGGTLAGADVTNVAVDCVDNPHTLGGILSGLETGNSVVLQNNGGDDLTLSANGAFAFPGTLVAGDAYAVTVLVQPAAPSETCTVTNGSGTMPDADVNDVSVTCAVDTFTVGGALTGLAAGENVVLQINGADDQVLAADGPFAFSPLADGTDYIVTVATQPNGQTCSVSNGDGTLAGADVTNVAVDCVDDATPPVQPPVQPSGDLTPIPVDANWALILLIMSLMAVGGTVILRQR